MNNVENIIKIYLKDVDSYKNKYNEDVLSYELSNYILEETKGIGLKQNINFIISSAFNMSEEEKENFVDMIRKSFGVDVSEIMNLRIKQRIANSSMFLTGSILVLIYLLCQNILMSQFILIFGWVFIGEGICNFLYKGIENKYFILKRKQIINAKIVFK